MKKNTSWFTLILVNYFVQTIARFRFNQLGITFSKEQTLQKVLLLENEMPGLLKYEDNVCSVDYLQDMMEICESREEEFDNLLNINQ